MRGNFRKDYKGMNRSDLPELHFITPIQNVTSIMRYGILCNKKAKRLTHASVAMLEIQDRRECKAIPGGKPLHDYVNLYLCARNPMMRKLADQHADLCVLRVSTAVLDIPEAIVTDGNAASGYTVFLPSPAGLEIVNRELVFAEYWTDPDIFQQWTKKRIKCAEVLVPDKVDSRFIQGAYVSCEAVRGKLITLGFSLSITTDAHLFFQ